MEEIPIWHILPNNDSNTHLEIGDCKCKPKIELLENKILIIHKSFYGREAVEWANEIINKTL